MKWSCWGFRHFSNSQGSVWINFLCWLICIIALRIFYSLSEAPSALSRQRRARREFFHSHVGISYILWCLSLCSCFAGSFFLLAYDFLVQVRKLLLCLVTFHDLCTWGSESGLCWVFPGKVKYPPLLGGPYSTEYSHAIVARKRLKNPGLESGSSCMGARRKIFMFFFK